MSESKARQRAELRRLSDQMSADRHFIVELLKAMAKHAGVSQDVFWPEGCDHVSPPDWYWMWML